MYTLIYILKATTTNLAQSALKKDDYVFSGYWEFLLYTKEHAHTYQQYPTGEPTKFKQERLIMWA